MISSPCWIDYAFTMRILNKKTKREPWMGEKVVVADITESKPCRCISSIYNKRLANEDP